MDELLACRLAFVLLNELYREWIQTVDDIQNIPLLETGLTLQQIMNKRDKCVRYDNWFCTNTCTDLPRIHQMIKCVPEQIKRRINATRKMWRARYNENNHCPEWIFAYLMGASSHAHTFYNAQEVFLSGLNAGYFHSQLSNLKTNLEQIAYIYPLFQQTHEDGTPITKADVQMNIDANRAFIERELKSEYRIKINEEPFRLAVEYLLSPVDDVVRLITPVENN